LDAKFRPAAADKTSVVRANTWQNAARARVVLLLVAAATGCLLASGCGAVSTQQSLGDAQKQLDEAKKLEGEEFAPYEYTRAASYFQKAKKLNGEGLYEQSAEYAKLAQLAAEKAQDVARLGKERKVRLQKFAPKAPVAPPAPKAPVAPGSMVPDQKGGK
jgi:hypothetical protein